MYRIRNGKKIHKNDRVSDFNFICKPNVPDFYSSLFISNKSKNSLEYGKKIGYSLISYFNFLLERRVEYWNATDEDVKAYILYIINFDTKQNEIISEPKIGYKTIQNQKRNIVEFYKFLWQYSEHSVLQINKWDNNKLSEYSTALTLRWNDISSIADATIDLFVTKHKSASKEYILEYTDEEFKAIYSNFRNYRNRGIFLATLHGMRIDEALSIKLKDYDPRECTVKPSRSKGKGKGRKRTVLFGKEAIGVIENYILNERNPAEVKSKKSSDYLFVNTITMDGEISFNAYTATSYRNALIRAAKRAGIEGNVRTHSGRSDKATKLVKAMASGELKLTDEIIRHIMGWKSPQAISVKCKGKIHQ